MPDANNLIQWPLGDTAARALGASPRRRGPFAALALSGLEMLYRSGVKVRNAAFDVGIRRAQHASVPVISIGNIVAGGAGKTPLTRWIVDDLMSRGRKVAVLHGGYGSDEPALHRRWQPATIVIEERNRVQAAAAAFEQGADVIVLDDAFQHRRLARDLDIVLLPVETQSSHLLPKGPLREPESALQRADLVIVTRKTATAEEAQRLAARIHDQYQKPVAVAAILPAEPIHVTGEAMVVAAIARPDLLLRQLQDEGVKVVGVIAYPDHHDYTIRDAAYIRRATRGLPILTTEKDAIKLVSVFDASELLVLKQKVVIEEGSERLRAMLERVL